MTDTRTPAEIAYDAARLSPAPQLPAQPSPLFLELKAWIDSHFGNTEDEDVAKNVPIGTLDGCTVFACFDGDGDMYQASLTWRGLKIATDGSSYVGLPHGEEVGCTGDIGFTDWLILSAATKAGILDALITLAQQHNHIDVIAGTARSELERRGLLG